METEKKNSEITSTGRLLDVIRGTADAGDIRLSPSQPEQLGAVVKAVKNHVVRSKGSKTAKATTVGVDIGHSGVSLVKTALSGHTREIVDCAFVPLPAGIIKGSPEFEHFLRSAITPFCTKTGKTETWAITSSAQVEVRLVRIPAVAGDMLEKAIFWKLKKEASFDEKQFFFDYEVRREVEEAGVKKLDVMCYTAPIGETEEIKGLFAKFGVPLAGISIVPFAIQNILGTQRTNLPGQQQDDHIACVFMGKSFSRIDLYADGKLTMTRDIKTGVSSMIETLAETLKNQDGEITLDEAQQTLFTLAENDAEVVTLSNGAILDRAELEGLIAPVLERFVRQLDRSFSYVRTTLGYPRVQKVYLSSAMPLSQGIFVYFQEQLGIACAVFDPLEKLVQGYGFNERIALIPAYGMALSDRLQTSNFIYTYKDKKKAAQVRKINRGILSVLIVCILACLTLTVYERLVIINHKKAELAALELQLQKSAPMVNKQMILQLASAAKVQRQKYEGLSSRYKGMALIAELSALTPEAVSLTGLEASLSKKSEAVSGVPGAQPTAAASKSMAGDKTAKGESTAVVEGIITGKQETLETALASYVMKLRASPLFADVTVTPKKLAHAGQADFLPFSLTLKMGPAK
jgi:Tfp pilus assembly PilM family ATPase